MDWGYTNQNSCDSTTVVEVTVEVTLLSWYSTSIFCQGPGWAGNIKGIISSCQHFWCCTNTTIVQFNGTISTFHHLTFLYWVEGWGLECEMWNEYCTFQQMGNKCQIFHSVFLDKISGKNEEFSYHIIDWKECTLYFGRTKILSDLLIMLYIGLP